MPHLPSRGMGRGPTAPPGPGAWGYARGRGKPDTAARTLAHTAAAWVRLGYCVRLCGGWEVLPAGAW